MNSKQPLIQFRYRPETRDGQICDFFRSNDSNISITLRSFITHFSGHEFLLSQNASEEEIRRQCVASINYFNALVELHKSYLLVDRDNYPNAFYPNQSILNGSDTTSH